jgi:hypothetical protein
MPRARYIRPAVLHGLFAAGLTLLSHLVWALMPLPQTPPPRPARSVAFTALSETRPLLASPILFSLPSSLGFSSVALQQRNRILPPLNSPLDLSLHTDLPAERLPPPPDDDFFPPPPVFSTPVIHPLPLPEAGATLTGRWQLHALSDDPDLPSLNMFRAPPLPSQPVRVTGTLHFNEFGQVQSLLIDPRPVPPADEILQALRLIRITRQGESFRIPFELNFQPAEDAR